MPIAHVVTFAFVEDTDQAVVDAFRRSLDDLSQACQGIESFHHGSDLDLRPGSADYAVAAVFIDHHALNSYLFHPKHAKLNSDFGPIIAGKSSAQFRTEAEVRDAW